jgi:hypothetical protein
MVFEMESSATGLKGLNKSAQGKATRVTRALPPPWVYV